MPRVSHYLGRWIRSTDWYPDYQLRLYDRRAGRWNGRRVHESVELQEAGQPLEPGHLHHELQHFAYRDISRPPRDDRPLHDARGRAVARRRPPDQCVRGRRPPAAGVRPQLHPARRHQGRRRRSPRVDAQLVLRVPEAGEALGAAARAPAPSTVANPGVRDQSAVLDRSARLMFSLHIDTARTWRGGQNQVLVTVMGLRALGHRDDAGGALGRRAAAARGGRARSDPARAEDRNGPQRRLAPLAHPQTTEARHRPRARSPRRRDGGARAVDEHGAREAAARRGAARRFPPAEQRRCRGGSTARWTASSARPTRSARCSSATAFPTMRAVTVHEGIDLGRVDAAPPANLHEELWLPHQAPIVGNVAALVPHKGQRHLIESRDPRPAPGARRAVRHCGRRGAAAGARTPDQGAPPREARAPGGLPPRRAVAAQGVRHLRDELGDRRASARRCSTPWRAAKPIVATTAGASRRSSSTARRGSSSRRAITRRWRTRSCGC